MRLVKKMEVYTTLGDIYDRVSILEIKAEKIKEGNHFQELDLIRSKVPDYLNSRWYYVLKDTNRKLWEIEDTARSLKTIQERSDILTDVHHYNELRAHAKNRINKGSGSLLETKKYTPFRTDLLIICHQGLGDFIMLNGMFRTLAANYHLHIFIKDNYRKMISYMLEDLTGITWYDVPPEHYEWVHPSLYSGFKMKTLLLGDYNPNNLQIPGNFMQKWYNSISMNPEYSWTRFALYNDPVETDELYSEVVSKIGPDYVVVQDSPERGFVLNLPEFDLPVFYVSSKETAWRDNIFLYEKVLRKAKVVHTFDSSFSHYIDRIDPEGELFCHIYVRKTPGADQMYRCPKWKFLY